MSIRLARIGLVPVHVMRSRLNIQQEKLVNLILEIRNIQKRSLDPRKKITCRTKIFRMDVIGDTWECEYFYLFLICHLILYANYNKLSRFLGYELQS